MDPAPRFTVAPSPIGDVLIVTVADAGGDAAEGIVWLHPVHGSLEADLDRAAHLLHSPVHPEETATAAEAAAQLDAYFAGDLQVFDVSLDWRLASPGFTRTALEAVCAIPYGETAGYGEVAIAAGSPRAARAVGTACRTTPFSLVVPVHRVVRADGSLGEYGGRPEVKRFLIDLERGL